MGVNSISISKMKELKRQSENLFNLNAIDFKRELDIIDSDLKIQVESAEDAYLRRRLYELLGT